MARQIEYEFIRGGDENSVVEIKYVNGGWLTVADSASLAAIDITRGGDGQLAYVKEDGKFYIATKVDAQPDFSTFPPGEIPAVWQWAELPFSGSFSGSFQGDGSGLTGVGGVPGGTVTQLQFHSASGEDSVFGGAEIYYISSSGNLGIGITNPSVKLHVDGDAIITGTLTAQEFHTEFVSASIIYQSGSTKFGNTSDDNHAFTGSVNISGSLQVTGTVEASELSGSFSGSFQGDGSNLTGIASTLALSGSTGNDLVNLKTDALTITGSARNIDVAVTDNQVEISVPDDLQLTNVELTGSFNGTFSGSFIGTVDAVITNAVTASYVLNAVSASYAVTSSHATTALTASYAFTASYAATAVTASYAFTASYAATAVTASYALTASIATSSSYALTSSYSSTALSASYAATAANAVSASYSTTASYVAGYVRDSGGQLNEIAIWNSEDQISGSGGFFVTRSYNGNVSTVLDGFYYAENNGGFIAHSTADESGSKSTIGMYDPGTGTAIIYAGSASGETVGAIKFAVNDLNQAYAIGTNISPNKANTLRIEPAVEFLTGATGSFSGSFYGQFVGLIDSASYAAYAVTATSASYSLTATSASYALTATTASHAVNALSASYAVTASYASTATSASYALTSTSASHALFANNATSASFAASSLTASYFTGSHIDFTVGVTPAWKQGRVFYDATEGALAVYNDVADVTMQVGQEFWIRAINKSGNPILNGTPVRISGSTGDRPNIWPAVAEDHVGAQFERENHIIGVATNDIADNATGYVTTQGIVRKLNTTAFTAGDTLYLQTGSAGFRNTPPPFPYDAVRVGWVTKVNAGNGLIFVEPKAPVHLRDIAVISGSENAVTYDVLVKNANGGFAPRHDNMILSGSFSGSFSGAIDRAVSASHAVQADSASLAVTASYALKAESVGTLNQDVTILGGLTVYGSSSFYHVTSSQLDVDSAFISVNVFEPAERFGGLRVYDSGSSDATASFAWDSLHNHWVYQNSSGSTYSGGMFLSGPRNTGSLGDEPGLTKWYVARSDGGDHLNNTQIYSSASTHIAYGDLFTTGTTSGSFVGDGSGLFGVAANPAGVDKSVQFKSGSLTGGASNFFYDHTAARVGIGTASPVSPLEVAGVVTTQGHRVLGNYANFTSLPGAGIYSSNVSFDSGYGALLIASRTDASNVIAFGTHNGTAMAERMRINDDGNVGIGMTNPSYLFSVRNSAGATVNIGGGNSNTIPAIAIQSQSGSWASSTNGFAYYYNATDGDLDLYRKNNSGTEAHVMTWERASGNVGVGTTAPGNKLHVYKGASGKTWSIDTGDGLVLENNDTFAINIATPSANQGLLLFSDAERRAEGRIGYAHSTNHMYFSTTGSEAMRINSDGNVGVGTTAPSAQLHVYSTGNGEIEVQRASGALFNIQAQASLATIGTDSNHPLYLKTNAGTRVAITTGGNVGIGTTNPTRRLSLYDSTSNTLALDLANGIHTTTLFHNKVDSQWYNGALAGDFGFRSDSGSFAIAMANEAKLYVESGSGNIGVGTTAPGKTLEVYSTTNPEIRISNGGGTSPAPRLTFYRQAGVSATMTYDVSNKNLTIQNDYSTVDANGLIQFNTRGANTRLAISGSGQVRFNAYGSATFTGTPTKSLAVDSSGNVIEIDVSSNGTGVANEVAVWKDTDTVSGSQDFTWDGTTLSINGILEANEKSFVIDHPTQPGKKLVYGVLEGPEHAVYCRGKISGNVIELPEEWTGLVDQESITVQLTSIGKHQNLYVVDIRDNKVFIKNGDLLTSKINAYYYIQGTRKDTKPLQTVRDK